MFHLLGITLQFLTPEEKKHQVRFYAADLRPGPQDHLRFCVWLERLLHSQFKLITAQGRRLKIQQRERAYGM